MLTFSEAWKHVVLAWWLLIMLPVVVFMSGSAARGVELTPGGVPTTTQPGDFVSLTATVRGTYIRRVSLELEEWLIATKAPYATTPCPAGHILVWDLPSGTLSVMPTSVFAGTSMQIGSLNRSALQQDWYIDAVNRPAAGSAASSLPYDKDGGTANESIVSKYIREGWGWDADGDGDVDLDDYKDIFDGDMDNDGVLDKDDWDTDGDGEPDAIEKAWGAINNTESRSYLDPESGFDRDFDGLNDLLDDDKDGVPNWVETKLGYDPESASSKPNGPIWFTGQPATPQSQWPDTDHDGAWDWLETLSGSDPNNAAQFPDFNGDGLWDWGKANVLLAFGNGGDPTDPTPTPPTPVPSGTATPTPQLVTGSTSGGATGGTAGTPLNPNTPGGSAGNNNNVVTGDFTVNNPGNNFDYGDGGGNGNGNGQGGDGDYVVQFQPRGQANNYMGVTGGSWQQRSGINYDGVLSSTWSGIAAKADALRAQMGSAPNAGADASHVVLFPIKWIDGTTKTYDLPLLPDSSTDRGQAANKVRTFIYMFAAVLSFYVFVMKIWTALRQF